MHLLIQSHKQHTFSVLNMRCVEQTEHCFSSLLLYWVIHVYPFPYLSIYWLYLCRYLLCIHSFIYIFFNFSWFSKTNCSHGLGGKFSYHIWIEIQCAYRKVAVHTLRTTALGAKFYGKQFNIGHFKTSYINKESCSII